MSPLEMVTVTTMLERAKAERMVGPALKILMRSMVVLYWRKAATCVGEGRSLPRVP